MPRTLHWCLLGALAAPLGAQQVDSTRVGVSRPVPPPAGVQARVVVQDTAELKPPISPRRAFLYSFILPGAGQAKLDRPYAGTLFFVVEATALALLNRSAEDLRIARAFSRDSVPLRYDIDPVTGVVTRDGDGQPVVAEWTASRYNDDWVRTRRLHYEDWLAVLFFNHLFAGADAFVAAQLWDLPAKLDVRRSVDGTLVGARVPVR